MDRFVRKELSGWGLCCRSTSRVYRPEKKAEVQGLLEKPGGGSLLGRGFGRSYGDAALNGGGGVILSDRINHLIEFDPARGDLTCEAGVTLDEILRIFLPRGWMVPVTPGTRFVTVAGAVACDVHGKNHHRDGAFSRHVLSLELLLADGQRVRCSPEEDPELFWATLGGLGLTGWILSVTLRLRPVATAFLKARYLRTRGLEETMSRLEVEDRDFNYSVAWLDGLARGRSMGRSVLILGNHAEPEDLPGRHRRHPFQTDRRASWRVPFRFPHFVLNRVSMAAFNRFYYRSFPAEGREAVVDYDRFFYPLDSILEWNRIYGRRGFLQYQCVLPGQGGPEAVAGLLEAFRAEGIPVFLAVLKRLGREAGPLSFPLAGYTLAADIPMLGRRLLDSLGRIDRKVVEWGGRVYLAKDASVSPAHFREMYPRFKEWLRVKERVDPKARFASDLSRRLLITPDEGGHHG